MQYYPNLSNGTANAALLVMIFDPLLQNSVLINLFEYLITDQEDGGCCYSKPLLRATLTLLILYCLWHMINTVITTMIFSKILKATPDGGINKKCFKVFCIFALTFFNLHIFAFGFAPSVHQFFEIQKMPLDMLILMQKPF